MKHTKCRRGHLLSEDNRAYRSALLPQGRCKICCTVNNENWRKKHLGKRRKDLKAWRRQHVNSAKKSARLFNLKRAGFTEEAYQYKKIKQQNKCAICKRKVKGKLHADHEHVNPPKPRGLLCGSCNRALGLLQDDSALCKVAAAYLNFYKRKKR